MCVPDLADRIIDAKTEEAVPAIPVAVSSPLPFPLVPKDAKMSCI